MRTDCRHYDSRTYPTGDVVRKCRIDLAPEAPWKCPDQCPRYERSVFDVGWQHGSLGTPAKQVPEPAPVLGDDVAALLDEAENIVNLAGADLQAEQERGARRKMFRKKKKRR
ncbi:MAG: hypothetical protein JWL83_2517 [Actinomycetia bacterium]|jgi:hypothetical protein|nr:hypothetical protein [Actinomycetes bacterium]